MMTSYQTRRQIFLNPIKPYYKKRVQKNMAEKSEVAWTLLLGLAFLGIVSSIVSWVGKLIFNFIMIETHHPAAQITFMVAWASIMLMGLVLGFFGFVRAVFYPSST